MRVHGEVLGGPGLGSTWLLTGCRGSAGSLLWVYDQSRAGGRVEGLVRTNSGRRPRSSSPFPPPPSPQSTAMLSSITRTLPRASLLARSTRAYATSLPPPPPVPAGTPSYDPSLDPQLAGLNYPQLSTESRQARSPRGWWDQQERVNFGEPVSLRTFVSSCREGQLMRRAQVPENDDIQSMWAPDIHKVKPLSAVMQLLTAFALVGVFAGGVYMIRAPAPAVRPFPIGWERLKDADELVPPAQLPRAYPYDGLVKELSGTEDALYAVRSSLAA